MLILLLWKNNQWDGWALVLLCFAPEEDDPSILLPREG